MRCVLLTCRSICVFRYFDDYHYMAYQIVRLSLSDENIWNTKDFNLNEIKQNDYIIYSGLSRVKRSHCICAVYSLRVGLFVYLGILMIIITWPIK